MRDRLWQHRLHVVHEYFGVSFQSIWLIIEKDMPTLKTQIQTILKELEP